MVECAAWLIQKGLPRPVNHTLERTGDGPIVLKREVIDVNYNPKEAIRWRDDTKRLAKLVHRN